METINRLNNQNNENRDHFSHELIDEYQGSRGVVVTKLSHPCTIKDIKSFIIERKRSNSLYANLIDGLELDYHESDTIEHIRAKEFLISSTCDFDTTVLSSDKRIYDIVRSDRIIPGNIRIYEGLPIIAMKMNDTYEEIRLDTTSFKTIMQTNPSIMAYRSYVKLHELGKVQFILGINGNYDDCDVEQKFNAMDQLYDTINGDDVIRRLTEDEFTGDYAYVIASKSLRQR